MRFLKIGMLIGFVIALYLGIENHESIDINGDDGSRPTMRVYSFPISAGSSTTLVQDRALLEPLSARVSGGKRECMDLLALTWRSCDDIRLGYRGERR